MLRAAVFGCALILATMTLGQSDFDFGDPSAGHPPQLPLETNYKNACRDIGAHLSLASPVFYPG
jgi:hypothetical protein